VVLMCRAMVGWWCDVANHRGCRCGYDGCEAHEQRAWEEFVDADERAAVKYKWLEPNDGESRALQVLE
jgi:hypothetical protein